MSDFSYIDRNLADVRENIARISAREGIPAPAMLAVTKSADDAEVLYLSKCGISMVGENRVQAFSARRELLCASGYEGEFHLIGSLQTNKVKYLIGKCSLIQSVDSEKLAQVIDAESRKRDCVTDILLEVNSGREEAKGGVFPEDFERFYESVRDLTGIRIRGVMTMAPICETQAEYAPYFRETYKLWDNIRSRGGFSGDPILSMGMSGSYEAAICEGATLIRIGRTLFKK